MGNQWLMCVLVLVDQDVTRASTPFTKIVPNDQTLIIWVFYPIIHISTFIHGRRDFKSS